MESQTAYQQTRRYPRFTAKHRALVLLENESGGLPYHIVQIGKGGLSFRYLGQKLYPGEIFRISLYYEDQLMVESIPAKLVSDYRLQDNLVPIRCSCVCFEELDDELEKKLDDFIRNCTVE